MPGTPISGLLAAADLRTKQFHLVKITSAGLALCGDGWRADGILINKPNVGESVSFESNDGVVQFVIAGAAVTTGSEVASNASGRAIPALSGDEAVGVAMEDASGDGSQFRIMTRFRGGLTG